MDKEQFDQILKEMDDFLNADHDYSELSKKVKDGNLTNEELQVFIMAFDELTYRINKIEGLVEKFKST